MQEVHSKSVPTYHTKPRCLAGRVKNRFMMGALIVAPAVVGLTLSGCGGGNPFEALSSQTVSLSSGSSSSGPGSPITISWSTHNLDTNSNNGFEKSNFLDVAGNLSGAGSIVDAPSTTTTYTMMVRSNQGNDVPTSVTVTVPKSSFRTLIVGDPNNADVPSVQSTLLTSTTVTPIVQTTLPADGTNYDLLVVHPSGNISPSDSASISNWLNLGKGVVILKRAARKLATGNIQDSNVSAIGGWFGGVASASGGGVYYYNNLSQTAIRLSRTLDYKASGFTYVPGQEFDFVNNGDNMECDSVGSSTSIVTSYRGNSTVSSWAFTPATGGRVFFSGALGSTDSNNNYAKIFLGGCSWAAGVQSSSPFPKKLKLKPVGSTLIQGSR